MFVDSKQKIASAVLLLQYAVVCLAQSSTTLDPFDQFNRMDTTTDKTTDDDDDFSRYPPDYYKDDTSTKTTDDVNFSTPTTPASTPDYGDYESRTTIEPEDGSTSTTPKPGTMIVLAGHRLDRRLGTVWA